MRALKAILTACGNLRRKPEVMNWPEDLIGLRALCDVNLPKFTSNDIPLFLGITSDLFPNTVLPTPDYGVLLREIENACIKFNLQRNQYFIKKCIQLYETIMVRHGLMVVGKAMAGKSSIIKVLKEAMSMVKDHPDFVKTESYHVNPKSIT
jgi:dynein heavy chain, axonemal